jgi:lysophospholipase L1-like esterase
VDGSYNSTFVNNDAVGTWENLGSSALDVTQGTGSAQPTFRTSIVGGQPVVRCDGGDRIAATTASDWTFLYQGADFTVEHVGATTSGNGTYLTTAAVNGGHGYASLSVVSSVYMQIVNATPATNLDFSKSSYTAGQFHLTSQILDDDGGAGNDGSIYLDSLAVATAARASTFSVTTAAALNVCAYAAAGLPLTGDLFRAIIYQSALTSTQRGINKAVDEWALGSSLPVVKEVWLFVGDSLTAGFGIAGWPASLQSYAPDVLMVNVAASGRTASQILAQWTANGSQYGNLTKVFVLGGINDIMAGTAGATAFASLEDIYQAAGVAGVQVIALATTPFGDNVNWTAPRQTELEALNALVLASTDADITIDLYTLMQDPADLDALLPAYAAGDGLHISASGTTFIADTVAAALGL